MLRLLLMPFPTICCCFIFKGICRSMLWKLNRKFEFNKKKTKNKFHAFDSSKSNFSLTMSLSHAKKMNVERGGRKQSKRKITSCLKLWRYIHTNSQYMTYHGIAAWNRSKCRRYSVIYRCGELIEKVRCERMLRVLISQRETTHIQFHSHTTLPLLLPACSQY